LGTSTLLSHISPQIKAIVFDPIQDIYKARQDPDFFLDSITAPLLEIYTNRAPQTRK